MSNKRSDKNDRSKRKIGELPAPPTDLRMFPVPHIYVPVFSKGAQKMMKKLRKHPKKLKKFIEKTGIVNKKGELTEKYCDGPHQQLSYTSDEPWKEYDKKMREDPSKWHVLPASTRKLAEKIAKSPKKSRQFMIDAGFCNKNGKLKKQFRP